MSSHSTKELREAIDQFAVRSTNKALALFLADIVLYVAAVLGTILATPIITKILFSIIAGLAICRLFVIGHDAAHGSYTHNSSLNAVIGRIAYLPALHNFSLWQVVHNRWHHRDTNFKGLNSWSPLSKGEFDKLPSWRKTIERLYRSPFGFGIYYFIDRWWRDKFFPNQNKYPRDRKRFLRDFYLIISYLVVLMSTLVISGKYIGSTGPIQAIVFGFVVPFAVWNTAIGMTVFLQHTHPSVPWFNSIEQWNMLGQPEDVTVHIKMPVWYNYLTHHVMDHPAHHVHVKIPLYNLHKAQEKLNLIMANEAVVQPFSVKFLFSTLTRCKLYDYDEHRWTNFRGSPTSERLIVNDVLTRR